METKRGALKALYSEMRGVQRVERKNRVRQLLEHNLKPADYLTAHGWIYVIEDKKILKTCYEKGNISKAGYRVLSNS